MMAVLPRRFLAPILIPALLTVMGVGARRCGGQIAEGAGKPSDATIFLTVGGENTQFPFYADNALGFDSGFGYQPHKLAGFEARIGSYPYSARFVQTPITAGYRMGADSFFGFPYAPFAYFGGGVSRSQDEGPGLVSMPAVFRPCWQADLGLDRTYARFSWRVVQISFRETYGPQDTLRSVGLSTGIVYRVKPRSPR
jgi:hypothetical protein